MATPQASQNADIQHTFAKHVLRTPADVRIISHSSIFYWWPAWVVGFTVALVSYLQGQDVSVVPNVVERVHASNGADHETQAKAKQSENVANNPS